MSRKTLIRTNELVYHITTRSNNKEWFYLSSNEVWRLCKEVLKEIDSKFSIEIHAFVLMNNHYHLMIRTPDSNIDKVMKYFNGKLSRLINRSAGRINHVFGAPYRWSLIENRIYYLNAIKYLYQNPVRAKICDRVENYPYSTFHKENLEFDIKSYLTSLDKEWLNEPISSSSKELIQKNLKKKYFRPGCKI